MTATNTKPKRDIFLFIGSLRMDILESIKQYEKETGAKYRVGMIFLHNRKRPLRKKRVLEHIDLAIELQTDSPEELKEHLDEIKDELAAVTCYGETNMPLFQNIIPLLPKHVHTPTVKAIEETTNKIAMRRAFARHNKSLTPPFMVVESNTQAIRKKIEKTVGFPLVVKPAGLQASLLVTICYHQEELEKTLDKVFRKIDALYKKIHGSGKKPQVLVEAFMEGEIYSIDAFISPKGKIYYTPPVRAINGRSVGFDDFFEYKLMTPTDLNADSVKEVERVAGEAIAATKLKSSSAHVELMRTEKGWMIIELGPRVGGWRDDMYRLSYGMEHRVNDLLVRFGRKPNISDKPLAHTVVMQFYGNKEGRLKKALGIVKARSLDSFYRMKVRKKTGDMCRFAKNGDKPVFDITLSNTNKADLLADIRRLEQMIKIEIE